MYRRESIKKNLETSLPVFVLDLSEDSRFINADTPLEKIPLTISAENNQVLQLSLEYAQYLWACDQIQHVGSNSHHYLNSIDKSAFQMVLSVV